MKLKLKKNLSVPRWKHVIPTIPKGTLVEYNDKDKTVKHPNCEASILIKDPEKYFEQLYLLKSKLPMAGKGKIHTKKEWKRVFGYEIGLVDGAKFVPIIDINKNPNL